MKLVNKPVALFCKFLKTHQDLFFLPSLSAGVWWLGQAVLDTLLVSFQHQNTAVLWEQKM